MINNLHDGIQLLGRQIQRQKHLEEELAHIQKRIEKSAGMIYKVIDSVMQNTYLAMSKVARERNNDYFQLPLVTVMPRNTKDIVDHFNCGLVSVIYRINPAIIHSLTGETPEGLEYYQWYMNLLYTTFSSQTPYSGEYQSIIKNKDFLNFVNHLFTKNGDYKVVVHDRTYVIDYTSLTYLRDEYQKLRLCPFIGDFRLDKETGDVQGTLSLDGKVFLKLDMTSHMIGNLKLAGEIARAKVRSLYGGY